MIKEDKPTFLLDMDGVLANFVQGIIDAHELPIEHHEWSSWGHHETLGVSNSDMWVPTNNEEDWWLKLEPYPWAKSLVDKLKEIGRVIYCTSPSLNSDCPRQKIDWLRKHNFMGNQNDYQIGPNKELFAKSGAILIDDYDANVEKFRAKGGRAVLFPQPWNKSRHFSVSLSDIVDHILLEIKLCS